MNSDRWNQGYNDYMTCSEYQVRPDFFSLADWLEYLDGVRSAAAGDSDE